MADWDGTGSTYRTLGKCSPGCTREAHATYCFPDHDYEMRQLRIFQKMVEKGERRLSLLSCPADHSILSQVSFIVTTGPFITRRLHVQPWLRPSWCTKTIMFRIQYTLPLI